MSSKISKWRQILHLTGNEIIGGLLNTRAVVARFEKNVTHDKLLCCKIPFAWKISLRKLANCINSKTKRLQKKLLFWLSATVISLSSAKFLSHKSSESVECILCCGLRLIT